MSIDWDAVIDRLQAGWCKGTVGAFKEPEGDVCLYGAVRSLMLQNPALLAAEKQLDSIIRQQFPDRVKGSYGLVPAFNDHPDTTLDDVTAVCEKARAGA